MNLLDYIKGNRKGKDAHRLEQEAMKNPFLHEAMEGLESVDANHEENIKQLYKRIDKKANGNKKQFYQLRQIAAACAIVLVFTIAFFLVDGNKNTLVAQQRLGTGLMEIYVPNEYYADNIALIALKNTNEVKEHREVINIVRPDEARLAKNMNAKEVLIAENNSPVNIYMPNELSKYAMMETETKEKSITRSSLAQTARSSASGGAAANITTGQNVDHIGNISAPKNGYEVYDKYMQNHMRHPNGDVKGDVLLLFDIDEDGRPFNFKIVGSLGLDFDREAVRLIKAGVDWSKPAKNIYYRVRF